MSNPIDSVQVELDETDQSVLRSATSYVEDRVAILRNHVPYVLDMSAREATLASCYGHTLQDKIDLYEMVRELGIHDTGLPNFFAFPSVSDQFIEYLADQKMALDPFFSTIAIEPVIDGEPFPTGPAAIQTVKYKIPNVILLVEIRPLTITSSGLTKQQVLANLRAHIRHYRDLLPAETDRVGRIYIRLGDPLETFEDDPDYLVQVLKMLGKEPITGILFEDVKGTRFPFETYALVKLMRHYHPAPRKILAHPHTANGTEDAAVLESILAGGDGVWSGFTPQAAQGGHGCALMMLTNLMRAQNPLVAKLYNTQKFQKIAERMWQIHDRAEIPANTPVVGERAYRYVDKYFEQTSESRDLDPSLIGRKAGFQIMPGWAPTYIIGKRLQELDYDAEIFCNQALLTKIRALINASQVEGKHVKFDEPENLAELVTAAMQEIGDLSTQENMVDPASSLTQRYR